VRNPNVDMSVQPSPELFAMSDTRFGQFSDAVQPRLFIVQRNRSLHLMTTAIARNEYYRESCAACFEELGTERGEEHVWSLNVVNSRVDQIARIRTYLT
jgi:hypothetical protein